MFASLLGLTMLSLLGPVLSDEQSVDEPVWWPAGDDPSVLEVPSGFMLALREPTRAIVRMVFKDGGFGPSVNLGLTGDALRLVRSDAGVIALFLQQNTQYPATVVLDPDTGQPLGAAHVIGGFTGARQTKVTGAPGRLLWSHLLLLPDAGASRTVIGPLSDDGTPHGSPVDITDLGALTSLASSQHHHWAAFNVDLADGGSGTTVHRLSDEGQPTAIATFEGAPLEFETLAATTNGVVVFAREAIDAISYAYIFASGEVGARGVWRGVPCWSSATAARGDDVWLACGGDRFANGSGVHMLHLVPDGGATDALLSPGDGGALTVGALVMGAVPSAVVVRVFSTVGPGQWAGSHLLPLSNDGLLATGPPMVALYKPNGQTGPSFSSRTLSPPLALSWVDTRLGPPRPLLEAARFAVTPRLTVRPPVTLGLSTDSFASVWPTGRSLATDGTDFLGVPWADYDVRPTFWPSDGGDPRPAARFSVGQPTFAPPLVSSDGTGYVISYAQFPSGWRWLAQRVDPRGSTVGSTVVLTDAGTVFDVLFDGEQHLQLIAEGDLRLTALTPSGLETLVTVPRADAKVTAARLAQAGPVFLIAWQEPTGPDLVTIYAVRFSVDAGVLDAPRTMTVSSKPGLTNLTDVGIRQGAFWVLGISASDGGHVWVWRPFETDANPVTLDGVSGVTNVVAGPELPNGELLIAYTRGAGEWAPEVQRLFVRTVDDDLPNGSSCMVNSDCVSRLCASGACATPPPVHAIIFYQLGCHCDASPGLWAVMVPCFIRFGQRRRRLTTRG